MHQTFYIDSDEEISSIIDRLNKSMSIDNYFVVPKRALFLQSVVNLKLLKREAEKIGKKIFIVTQDEFGGSMAERAGIEVLANMDGLESISDLNEKNKEMTNVEHPSVTNQQDQEKVVRLNGVGSTNFYDLSEIPKGRIVQSPPRYLGSRSRINKSVVASQEGDQSLSIKTQVISPYSIQSKTTQRRDLGEFAGSAYKKQLDPNKIKTIEKMFSSSVDNADKTPMQMNPLRERKIRKFFIGFAGLCFLALTGIATFLYFPSAKISITPNVLKDNLDLDIHASGDNIELAQSSIPVRIIDKEESITLPYEVSGINNINGKKAHGSVVIYNEYDNNPQTLIATTRLETTDGKIFRIQKNITIPGMTNIDGEMKPGAVSVDIIADKAGSEFNVDSTKFTIPGFKDGAKYDKFYAKSSEALTGGSSESVGTGGTVSQENIDRAKKEAEIAINDKITQEIDAQLINGEVVLSRAKEIKITKSFANVKVGDMANSFDYTIIASVHALVFFEKDVKDVINFSSKDSFGNKDAKMDILKIDYGTAEVDFDNNVIDVKVHSELSLTPIINTEQIKMEMLGKKDDQLSEILRKYSTIKNVDVEFSPSFVSFVPQYAQRVVVEIKN